MLLLLLKKMRSSVIPALMRVLALMVGLTGKGCYHCTVSFHSNLYEIMKCATTLALLLFFPLGT